MSQALSYIDLFAGCGGLSLGIEQAGFNLALAVEKSDMAAQTFYHNFISPIKSKDFWSSYSSTDTPVEEQVRHRLVVKELSTLLENTAILKEIKEMNIDLVAGGPPCQGFSLAGRRNPLDARNQLPWQFLDFVRFVKPKAVLIENVSGMQQDFIKHGEKAPFHQLRQALSEIGKGYAVQSVFLNAMHFGVPQHRPRVMLLAIRSDIAKQLSIKVTDTTWRSEFDYIRPSGDKPILTPQATTFEGDILTVADAFFDIDNSGYIFNVNSAEYKKKKGQYSYVMRTMNGLCQCDSQSDGLKNHSLRKHSEEVQQRFRLYQYLRDNKLPFNLFNVTKHSRTSNTLPSEAYLADLLSSASFPAISPDGKILGQTPKAVAHLILKLATKKHSQRPLNWDAPSPTIVSLPDDFVHPVLPRTLTVREMARLQSFPDSFEFMGKETTGSLRRRFEVPQYTQVGNAVPPLMSHAVGKLFKDLLSAKG